MAISVTGAGSEPEIQELLDKAERLMQRIRHKLNEVVEKINSLLSAIPGILVPDGVVEGIEAGIRRMDPVVTGLFRRLLLVAGSDVRPRVLRRPRAVPRPEFGGRGGFADGCRRGACRRHGVVVRCGDGNGCQPGIRRGAGLAVERTTVRGTARVGWQRHSQASSRATG